MILQNSNYVLVTAAHNEARFIEKVISSVVNQILRPSEWIIVSDNSSDQTEEIVSRYLNDYKFIKLIVKKTKEEPNFSSKVFALNLGINNLTFKDYNFIGILDADVTFEEDFYSKLILEFEQNKKLGIAGGDYYDIVKGKKKYVKPSPYSIRGATQFFRRECFEQIKGLYPMKYGGEDALACYAARMYGWEIKNVGNLIVLHHRPTGMTGSNVFRTRLRDGFVEYSLGYHPLFQLAKSVRRILESPPFIGSLLRFMGYWYAKMKGEGKIDSQALLRFIREVQIKRIFRLNFDKFSNLSENRNKNLLQ